MGNKHRRPEDQKAAKTSGIIDVHVNFLVGTVVPRKICRLKSNICHQANRSKGAQNGAVGQIVDGEHELQAQWMPWNSNETSVVAGDMESEDACSG